MTGWRKKQIMMMKCCGNRNQNASHVCNKICPNNYKFEPTYVVRYICSNCEDNIGYLGWLFTVLGIPFLKHQCKENNK
jgi:hypothetical protein